MEEKEKDTRANEQELIDIPFEDMMLTTMDNPFNPKENYEQWRFWDIQNDYCTEALLARLVEIPENMEDPVAVGNRITEAMLSIAENDALGMYKIV